MTTTNDLHLNELLVRVAQLQPVISQLVREGRIRAAAEYASMLSDVSRQIDWRLQELLTETK